MRYTWDPEKDALNRRKHGLSLKYGIPALTDPDADSWIDDRFDYGEERTITLGMGIRMMLFVVTTMRSRNGTRIISVRKATKNETERYLLDRS
jgi:uncharacterized DUF497 family protein